MTWRRDDPQGAGRVGFVFAEVFTFTGDRISRPETFHINLGGPGDTLVDAPIGSRRPLTAHSASQLT
jgi:hypothetical protein